MASKKSAARRVRARRLRDEITSLTKESDASRARTETPAEFVHRRMAELAKQQSKSRQAS